MNTLTNSLLKRALSILLVTIMVFSLGIVGITTTSAAEVELAETSADDTFTVYFENNWLWTDVCVYYWKNDQPYPDKEWPGVAMSFSTKAPVVAPGDAVFEAQIPSDADGFKFSGIKDDGSGIRDKSPDITDKTNGMLYSMKWNKGNEIEKNDKYVVIGPTGTFNPSITAQSTAILGEEISVVIESGAQDLEDYTILYTLKEGDNVIGTAQSDSNVFSYTASKTGEITLTAIVEIDGYPEINGKATWEISVSEPTELSLDFEYNSKVELGNSITIKLIPSVNIPLTYYLYTKTEDGYTEQHSNNSTFTISTSNMEIGDEYTYYVKAVSEGGLEATTKEFTITIIEPSQKRTITVNFKSSDSQGYLPAITTTGAISDLDNFDMNKSSVIVDKIAMNPSMTGYYYWYSATFDIPATTADYVVHIELVNSFDLGATGDLTIKPGTNDYYIGVDNLYNGLEFVDLTGEEWNDYRNWCKSASNMIFDISSVNDPEAANEMVPVAANYRLVSMGDANDDGKLNVRDATIIQKDLANITDLSEVGSLVADVNDDGRVTIKDATAIQKQLAGL